MPNLTMPLDTVPILSVFRLLGQRVEELMAHRGDYPNYFVRPTIMGKYFRSNVYEIDKLFGERGLDTDNVSIPTE